MASTEATEPTEPTDRTDPFELMLSMESVGWIDHRERGSERAIGSGHWISPLDQSIGSVGPAYLVTTALPATSTTYHRPPALVSAWPVAVSGVRSGGQKYSGHPL